MPFGGAILPGTGLQPQEAVDEAGKKKAGNPLFREKSCLTGSKHLIKKRLVSEKPVRVAFLCTYASARRGDREDPILTGQFDHQDRDIVDILLNIRLRQAVGHPILSLQHPAVGQTHLSKSIM